MISIIPLTARMKELSVQDSLFLNRSGGYSVKGETCCDDIYQYRYIIPPVFTIMGRVFDVKDSAQVDGAAVELLASAGKIDSAASSSAKMFEFYRGSEFENYTVTAIKDGYYQNKAKPVQLDSCWMTLCMWTCILKRSLSKRDRGQEHLL